MATALFWFHLAQGRAGDPQPPPPLLVHTTPAQLYWHHPFCSSLTSMPAAIFSVIYTKKHNIRHPLAKISWKIIGCFTVLCIVFICLNRICVQIFEPPKAGQVSWYLQSSASRTALWKKMGLFSISKGWRQSQVPPIGGKYFYFKKSKDLQSTRFEKYECMDYLSSHLVFYCSSPRLSPGVLSMMQHTNALPCSEQEKALWM